MFANKTLDRAFFAFGILSAWALSALYLWVFTTKTITYDAWGIVALICAAFHPLFALIFTFIGWRYVLTGNDLPPTEIGRLREERDEARREICESTAESADLYPREFAEKMGWDCYKEDSNALRPHLHLPPTK